MDDSSGFIRDPNPCPRIKQRRSSTAATNDLRGGVNDTFFTQMKLNVLGFEEVKIRWFLAVVLASLAILDPLESPIWFN